MKSLIQESEIQKTISKLGSEISYDYQGSSLIIVGVLTGSVVFLADLIRHINIPLHIDFIRASSYIGTKSTGRVLLEEHMPNIKGHDVIIVDDILDTGNTLERIINHLKQDDPASVSSVVLLWKQISQSVKLEPDYYGFKIPEVFVVGYGLDYNSKYRNLPYLAELENADLK